MAHTNFTYTYGDEGYPLFYKTEEFLADPSAESFDVRDVNPNFWLRNIKGSWGELDYSCVAYVPIRKNNFATFVSTDVRYSTNNTKWNEAEYSVAHGLELLRNRDTGIMPLAPGTDAENDSFVSDQGIKLGQQSLWGPGAACAYALGPRHIFIGGIEGVSQGNRLGWMQKVFKKCYFITRDGELISRLFSGVAADADRFDASIDGAGGHEGTFIMKMADGEEDFPEGISFLRTYDRNVSNTTGPSGRVDLGAVRITQQGEMPPLLCNFPPVSSTNDYADVLKSAVQPTIGGTGSPVVYQNQKVAASGFLLCLGDSAANLIFKGDNNEAVIGPTHAAAPNQRDIFLVLTDYVANGTDSELVAVCQACLARKVTNLNTLTRYLPIHNHPNKPQGPVLSSKGVISDLVCEVKATQGTTSSTIAKSVPIRTSVEDTTFTSGYGAPPIQQFVGADNKIYIGQNAAPIVFTGGYFQSGTSNVIPNQAVLSEDTFRLSSVVRYKRSGSNLVEVKGYNPTSLNISALSAVDGITSGDSIEGTITHRFPGRNSDSTLVITANATAVVSPTGISYGSLSGTTEAGGTLSLTVNYGNTPDPPPNLIAQIIAAGVLVPNSIYSPTTRVLTINLPADFAGSAGDAIVIGFTAQIPHGSVTYSAFSSTLP